jgi:hypothetical protein
LASFDCETIGNPNEDSSIVSVPLEHFRNYQSSNNEHEQADILVNWFAGWTNLHAHELRRFTVICPKAHRQGTWQKKYQHLMIHEPKDYIEGLEKQKKVAQAAHNVSSNL